MNQRIGTVSKSNKAPTKPLSMRIALLVLVLCLALSAGILASCGGGSESDSQEVGAAITRSMQQDKSDKQAEEEAEAKAKEEAEQKAREEEEKRKAEEEKRKAEEEAKAKREAEEKAAAEAKAKEEAEAKAREEVEARLKAEEEERARLEAEEQARLQAEQEAAVALNERDYVLNTNPERMRFHEPSCKSVKQIKESNVEYFYGDRQALIDQGFTPCGNCNP